MALLVQLFPEENFFSKSAFSSKIIFSKKCYPLVKLEIILSILAFRFQKSSTAIRSYKVLKFRKKTVSIRSTDPSKGVSRCCSTLPRGWFNELLIKNFRKFFPGRDLVFKVLTEKFFPEVKLDLFPVAWLSFQASYSGLLAISTRPRG